MEEVKPEAKLPEQHDPQDMHNQMPEQNQQPVMRKFESKSQQWMYPAIAVLVVLAGIGTGYLLSGASANGGAAKEGSNVAKTEANTQAAQNTQVDEDTFSDTAEGIMQEGGADGEGTHHLERGQGPQKDVYLLSTVIDLDSFVGKKVQVWGQTVAAQDAGWLMDVGKVKVLE